MARQRETRLLQRVRRRLIARFGGRYVKVHGSLFQEAGISDLLGCVEGLFIALEVKTPEDRRGASDLQKEFIADIIANGGLARVVKSPQEAIAAVERHLAKAGRLPAEHSFRSHRAKAFRGVLRARNREDVDSGRDHRKRSRRE